jgi:hypothetical protein
VGLGGFDGQQGMDVGIISTFLTMHFKRYDWRYIGWLAKAGGSVGVCSTIGIVNCMNYVRNTSCYHYTKGRIDSIAFVRTLA